MKRTNFFKTNTTNVAFQPFTMMGKNIIRNDGIQSLDDGQQMSDIPPWSLAPLRVVLGKLLYKK